MKHRLRRVLVTGSRDHEDEWLVHTMLDRFRGADPEVLVAHGAQRGADHFALTWANQHLQPRAEFPPNWNKYGKAAGPIRNRQMLHTIQPDLVLAFPLKVSVGTRDMIDVAGSLGYVVKVITCRDDVPPL